MGAGTIRNAPCFCGSGKKAKKCCMNETEVRKCQICQKENSVPKNVEQFNCSHCGSTLEKLNEVAFTEVSNVQDDLDKYIQNSILMDFFPLNAHPMAFPDEKQRWEFMEKQMQIARSLQKANKHLRDYKKDEESEKGRLKSLNDKRIPGQFIGALESIEVEANWDAFLMQLKAALDTGAGLLDVTFGTNFHGWHKGTDKRTGKQDVTGAKILNHFRQYPKPSREIIGLIDFIEGNLDWASRIVTLRDKPVHKGRSDISEIIFNPGAGITHGAKVVHGEKEVEDTSVYMERVLSEMAQFFRNLVYIALNHKLQRGMKIGVTEKELKFVWIDDPTRSKKDA